MNIKNFFFIKDISGFAAISGSYPDIAVIIKSSGIFYE